MDAMVIVFIVFMSFVSVMCLFALFIVVRDLLVNDKDKKETEPVTQILPVSVPFNPAPPAPSPAEEKSEPPAEEESTDDSVVKFAPKEKKTLDEAFFELDDEKKGYYIEVARYASAVPTVTKHVKNDSYEEWKVGLARLIRMKIRRGEVLCEFNIQNSEMKGHISGSGVSVKQSQTMVKLENRVAVQFVLESIDLAAKIIEEEKAAKKEEQKKARIEREQEKREQAKKEAEPQSGQILEEAAVTEPAAAQDGAKNNG